MRVISFFFFFNPIWPACILFGVFWIDFWKLVLMGIIWHDSVSSSKWISRNNFSPRKLSDFISNNTCRCSTTSQGTLLRHRMTNILSIPSPSQEAGSQQSMNHTRTLTTSSLSGHPDLFTLQTGRWHQLYQLTRALITAKALILGQMCLCGEGKNTWPMTWHLLL